MCSSIASRCWSVPRMSGSENRRISASLAVGGGSSTGSFQLARPFSAASAAARCDSQNSLSATSRSSRGFKSCWNRNWTARSRDSRRFPINIIMLPEKALPRNEKLYPAPPPIKLAAMLNYIWLGLMVAAVLIGAANDTLDAVGKAAFERAEYAVMKLALPLAGVMALWLGIMRLAEKAGLIQVMARALRPVMRKLFPDVPPEHPAMGSMLMNMAANILGLSNAATPLGIRAMKDLETLNPRPGVASNAMCTFLAINTASVQLIPATAIALLASAGSTRPTAIVGTALLATLCAATVAITSAKLLEKLPFFRLRDSIEPRQETKLAEQTAVEPPVEDNVIAIEPRGWRRLLPFLLVLFFLGLLVR